MILSVTFSKPTKDAQIQFGKPVEKIKISIENSKNGTGYFVQIFTKTQVFHEHFSETQLDDFIKKHAGTTFKNCVKRTQTEEITILANKKGKITELRRPVKMADSNESLKILPAKGDKKKKNYLLPEGTPVPFLVLLGIMNSDGKVIASRYDKFRQINRFLEFIDDILPEVYDNKNFAERDAANDDESAPNSDEKSGQNCLRIADFGCGKSYLTFAVHYFLTQIKHIPCQIEGLDLKEDVIKYCNDMKDRLGLEGLFFHTGNIADYSGKNAPDIVITLHACDTATDFALKYAVEKGAKAILSVPCCQHQVNTQLQSNKNDIADEFAPLLRWGIIREKFSSLVTDALRGQWLENQGYNVQMLEFIDMEHTPKNIMIRAVKKRKAADDNKMPTLAQVLKIEPEIFK